jgi:predicted phage terminase large subunit-like protein
MGTYLFSSLYLNKPLAKEFMAFNPDWIRNYEESDIPEEGRGVVTHDPADPPTGKKSQDYSALVACWHSKRGVHVRGYIRARMTDAQAINSAIDLALKYGCTTIRVEVDRYAHLQFAYREEMKRRGVYLSIDAVKTKGKQKEGRIRQRLQPLFENGVIYTKANMRELEEELFAFPNGQHDDLIDALAWQIEDIYPTEKEVPKLIVKRRLPTIDEMIDTLYNRGGRRYPFNEQLKGTIFNSNFKN